MRIKATQIPPILGGRGAAGAAGSSEDALREEMQKARDQVGAIFRTGVKEQLLDTKPFAPVNDGTLVGGIDFQVTGPLSIRVTPPPVTRDYAVVQELGRRPGRRGPPLDAILRWVEQKFGLSGKEAQARARAVQRKLHRSGMAGRFFFRRARQEPRYRQQAVAMVNAAIRRWIRRVA